ncbi:MAG: transposase, partial [Gammaproteobacteria bacterium]|nr:transposase [Gammaproteobacteria bacterium]
AQRRFDLSVLNYIATSNHVHLLILDQGNGEIPAAMQLIAGRIAQEFNRRKHRHGAFWEDRYHATAVQTDQHLAQCMTYIDLNMVRAAAVTVPGEWDVSGYSEIQCPWKRKGVIDFPTLCQLLNARSMQHLAQQRMQSVQAAMRSTRREPAWTEAVAVGDEAYLRALKSAIGVRALHRRLSNHGELKMLQEPGGSYIAEATVKP